jgi:hypothetical protein
VGQAVGVAEAVEGAGGGGARVRRHVKTVSDVDAQSLGD